MKIVITGTRGIPGIQGGVETHCEELLPRLAKLGFDIYLIKRSCYSSPLDKSDEFNGVKLKTLYAPHIKSMEAITHTFLSILWAKKHKADILHIHAIGPALLVPFARLLGLKVIFTHHGFDYDRAKWGRFAKFILRLGERAGTQFSNEVIVISKLIQDHLALKYRRTNTHLIYNGVPVAVKPSSIGALRDFGLISSKYVFTLGRFVEEKGFDLLIDSFSEINDKEIRLVIAGDADHETPYSMKLKEQAKAKGVILTGYIKGLKLQEVFYNARLFVLPSYHEGLPISLLEAMSYNLPVVVSDIPANKQMKLPADSYFTTGDRFALRERINQMLASDIKSMRYDMSPYNWEHIATQTFVVYEKILEDKNKEARKR